MTDARTTDGAGVALWRIYLGPGSTVEHGPALATGFMAQETGWGLCTQNRHSLGAVGASYDAAESTDGAYREISGEVDTDTPGIVLGRGFSAADLRRVAATSRVVGDRLVVDAAALPDGFRLVGEARVAPGSLVSAGINVEMKQLDGDGFARYHALTPREGAVPLVRFWRRLSLDAPCRGGHTGTTAVRALGDAVAAVVGRTRTESATVARGLRRGTDAEWQALGEQGTHVTDAEIRSSCRDPDSSLVSGRSSGLVWVVGVPHDASGLGCASVVVRESGLENSRSSAGLIAGSTPNVLEVRLNLGLASGNGSVQLVGGWVAPAITEVKVRRPDGTYQPAVLGCADATGRRPFAGAIAGAPSLFQTQIVAVDATGRTVATWDLPH